MKGHNMLRYWITLCLAVLTVLPLGAAPVKKTVIPEDVPKNFSAREKAWLKSALSEEFLLERTSAIAREFLQSRDLQIPRLKLAIQELKAYEKYYFLEYDSKISRRWIRQNIAFAEALLKARAKMNFLVMNKQTDKPEYRQLYDYYVQTARQYRGIAAKPVRVVDRKRIVELGKIKKAVVEQLLAAEGAPKQD